jgi:hypothetical protein
MCLGWQIDPTTHALEKARELLCKQTPEQVLNHCEIDSPFATGSIRGVQSSEIWLPILNNLAN